jgi:cephalosporin hydroxylase
MRAQKNPLEEYFLSNPGRQIDKWMHYFDIYDRHLSQFRGGRVTVVEFGVQHGGSMQMWKKYFGRKSRIIGIDIDPRCLATAENGAEVILGDQDDRAFLNTLSSRIGDIDVVIDDGGHTMTQQINTFESLWPAVVQGGVYLAEDLHTSYWERFGGGYKRPGTFIEYAKDVIDQQNAWYTEDRDALVETALTTSVGGLHVYDSVIVFDKATRSAPERRVTGTPSF